MSLNKASLVAEIKLLCIIDCYAFSSGAKKIQVSFRNKEVAFKGKLEGLSHSQSISLCAQIQPVLQSHKISVFLYNAGKQAAVSAL